MKQREIKFRAYHNGEIKDVQWITFPITRNINFGHLGHDGQIEEVEGEFEIMQYTGLKDKNGKEIYEGDILQARNSDGDGVGKYIIEWDFVRYRMKNVNGDDGVVWLNSPYIEICGNRFENPELLT